MADGIGGVSSGVRITKDQAQAFVKDLTPILKDMKSTCTCGGTLKVKICDEDMKLLVYALEKGKFDTVANILKKYINKDKIQELRSNGEFNAASAKTLQLFLKRWETIIPLQILTPEVNKLIEEAINSPRMVDFKTNIPHLIQISDVTQLAGSIKKFLVDMMHLPKPAAIVTIIDREKTKTKAPELLEEKPIQNKQDTKPTLDTTRKEASEPVKKIQLKEEHLMTNNDKRTDLEPTRNSQSPIQENNNHLEKIRILEHKLITIIQDKTPESTHILNEIIIQIHEAQPQEVPSKMNTLANVIAHVGKADSTQLHPTLTTLHSLIHLPAETLTTVGHSLALVAKQQPEHLPVIRALLESVPQTAKTLTAVAHIILVGIEATPHAQQEGPTPRTLPSLAAVAMSVSKIAPENLSPVATTLINVAQTHPEVVPQLTQALNVIATKSPETLKIIPQLIQTVATHPDSLPQLATTLLALGNTATPQQITQSIHQIATTALEKPHTAPLLLEALHTAINTASAQHPVSPMLQQTEIRNAVFRATPTPHTASDIQTKGITISQQPAQTSLSQLRAQKEQNLTLHLINSTAKTAPETLPLIINIFKSIASQPLISTKILTVLQDIQQQHPKDMPKVVKALSNFVQSAPQHLSKAITLMSSVLTRSPQTLAPLATALQIISTGPITLQKEALKHLDMARNKNMQTLHHSCSEMAKLALPPSPRSESAGAMSPQSAPLTSGSVISESATLLTPPQNTESRHFHLETTPLSPKRETEIQQKSPTPTPAHNDHPSEPTSRESVAKAPEPTLRKTPLNAPQTTHKAEAISQPVRETAPQPTQQTRPQTNVTPMQTLALFGQISAQAPRDLAATRMTVATITTKAPAALGQTFATISAVGTHAPQHLAAVVTLLSAIADKAPAALAQVATALSDIATHAPQHLDRAIALLSTIADKAPSALAQVATALSDIATHAPQHLDRAIALLSTIADKAPTALAQVATTLTTVATLSPQRLGATVTLLSAIADKAPSTLAQIATSLNTFAQKSPELFNMVLEIGHKIADKAPELLPKFAQFLTQFHDTLHTDKLHTQLMALMQALAAEASEESTHLLQKLLSLGELKAAEDPALHAYVSSEIKKTRDKAKKAQANNVAKQSSTDQLIHMFDRMEMENWKLAAMFRKSLQGAQLR